MSPVAAPWWDDDTALADALAAIGRDLAIDAPPVDARRRAVVHWLAAAAVILAVAVGLVLAIASGAPHRRRMAACRQRHVRSFPTPRSCRPTRSPDCSVEPRSAAPMPRRCGAVLGDDLDAVSSSASARRRGVGAPRWWRGRRVARRDHVVGGRLDECGRRCSTSW